MVDKTLEESWELTSAHLERAHAHIPNSRAVADGTNGSSLQAEYREYLDHNELGLALDTLETIGKQIDAPAEFWRNLEKAASQMQLLDRAAAIRSKHLDVLE